MIVQCDIGKPTKRSLAICSEMLVRLNVLWLKQRKGNAPRLMRSGVRYRREIKPSVERFQRIPEIIRRGSGDCEDLASWRCAELRYYDRIAAVPWILNPRPRLFHVVVRLPNGRIEDPSAALGMPT